MNCVNCGYLLPSSNIKECPLCGMKFPQTCFSCGQPNPFLARYCFYCGSKMIKEEMESTIQNFDVLSDKRKNVAVMFADVSGFTALSEKMDPEEVREIINGCFEYITKPIYEMEGTIDKYIGDCIMMLFGARYTHIDDPKRAVLCGLRMLELISKFSEEKLASKGVKLNLSIGINFGLVVTGSVGNYFDKDYTVMGDVVNTAQRLQSSAGGGKILVSESVYLETKDSINYGEPLEITVKNKEKPVLCYAPNGLKIIEDHEGLYLVNRDYELNLLHETYNKNNGIKSITVSGESGIGKTTLIRKFISELDEVKSIKVDCSSIYQNRVNFVMSSLLHEIFDVATEGTTSIKETKVLEYIKFVLSDLDIEAIQKNYNFISLVMGLERDRAFKDILNSMLYSDIEREVSQQVALLIGALCKKTNIIFIIEDFQWVDTSSKKILKQLIEALADIRTFFVFSVRNDAEVLEFDSKDTNVHIKLQPFDISGTHKMVSKMLYCTDIDQSFFDIIIKYTNGNPLYIHEFINSVKRKNHYFIKDQVAYIKELEIYDFKDTIENIILSNVTDLDEISTHFLQIASVFGKEFRLSWVTKLLNELDVETQILELQQLNIITLKSVGATLGKVEKLYMFTQETLREVIYGSILNRSKKEYHKAVVGFIEEDYFDELDKYYEILCIHCENAGLYLKAADYYYKTAAKYKNDFNLDGSLDYYDAFIRSVEKLEGYKDEPKIVGAYMDTGYIHTILSNYELALQQLNRALQIAKNSEDTYLIKLMISKIFMGKGMYGEALEIIDELTPKIRENSSIFGQLLQLKCHILRIQGNTSALDIAEKAEEILSKARDYGSLSETMIQAGILYFIKGETENSLYYLDKAYNYAEKINNLAAMTASSRNLGIVYHASGRVSKALEQFTRSLEFSKKISNLQGIISGNINLGILYLDKGLFNKAQSLFEESLREARRISSVLYECATLTNLGDIMCEIGDYQSSWKYYEQSIEISKKHELPIEEGINYIGMANINLELGALEKVPDLLQKSYEIFTDADEISYLSDYSRYMSVYLLACDNLDSALEYCEEAISKADESKSDLRKLKALRVRGNILVKLENCIEAIETYTKSIALSVQLESDYELAQGYYQRSIANKKSSFFKEADNDLRRAAEAIGRIDTCKWTTIIHSERAIIGQHS